METSQTPTLSLCLPAFQAERFIRTAIESCLAQTVAPQEIVVSDDASTDATRNIIAQYQDAPRVRIIYPPAHLGIARHYEHVVRAATGTHVTVLSGDDALHPRFVAEAVEELKREPDLGLLVFAGFHCDARMRPTSRFGLSYPRQRLEPPSGFHHFVKSCQYLISFAVWPRDFLTKLPTLPDDAGLATDWYWALLAGASLPVRYSRKPRGYYRLHEANVSHAEFRRWQENAERMLAFLAQNGQLPEQCAEALKFRPRVPQDAPRTGETAPSRMKGLIKRLAARLYWKHPPHLLESH